MEDVKKLLVLEQEFHSFKEQTEHELIDLKKTIRYQDNRLKEMEMSKQKTEYQYDQIIQSLKTLNEKTIPNLTSQIEELKNKPAKRYDTFITALISGIAGIAVTLFAGKYL